MPFQRRPDPPVNPGDTVDPLTGDIITPPGSLDAYRRNPPRLSSRYYLKPHLRYPTKPQAQVMISPRAWDYLQSQSARYGYDGRSRTTGLTHYLVALLEANPDPFTDWADNRPQHYRDLDPIRINPRRPSRYRFPQWLPGDESAYEPDTKRKLRHLNKDNYLRCYPTLLALANHFLIASPKGHQTVTHIRINATIEAIGLQHLVPLRPPQHNPNPVPYKNRIVYARNARNARRNVELVF